MNYKCFDVEITDMVAQVRMIRPEKANSMIPEFWKELPEIVNDLSDQGEARVIVISAEGRHFCSGMDLSVFDGDNSVTMGSSKFPSRTRASFRSTALRLQRSFSCMEESRLPVLVAIQGACVGGGIDMISAADLRYATSDAYFCIAEINIGMTADVGTLQRMPKLVPEGVVRELAYTGRKMNAAEGKDRGFINEVFETHEELLAAVNEVAKEIASKSPMAIWGTKQSMNFSRDHSVADGLEYIATWNASMLDVDAIRSSYTAQAEGEKPQYDALLPVKKTAGE